MSKGQFIALLLLVVVGRPDSARAAGLLPLDPSVFPDLNVLLGSSVVSGLVKGVGLATDHKAYESASPYGMQGADIAVEFSMVKLPDSFNEAMAAAGASSDASALPFLPLPKLNIHKGFSDRFDLGFSGIWYQGIKLYGYEAKFALHVPEEGPTWALRLSYTHANFTVSDNLTLQLTSETFTPVVLVSRKLDFADPYLGVGPQVVIGKVTITSSADPSYSLSGVGRGLNFIAFTGVSLKLPRMGFKLVVEGAYSYAGASALGAKFGLAF